MHAQSLEPVETIAQVAFLEGVVRISNGLHGQSLLLYLQAFLLFAGIQPGAQFTNARMLLNILRLARKEL